MTRRRVFPRAFRSLPLALSLLYASCAAPPSGERVTDEAMRAGRTGASLPGADEDYFRLMDGGVRLTPAEARGRNMWLVWTGGNDRFWDQLTALTFGSADLLKIVSSHPGLGYGRDNRWNYLGLTNEPCFHKATAGDPQRFGLWLDARDPGCAPDPFENATKYPGVAVGARGRTAPAGPFYGYASGVLGLRLFPNPEFDEAAARAWDPERYYSDPSYYQRKDLVRPYRVGMACAFCHVGPNPERPPNDPEHPRWENISSLVGAQYFWIDRVLAFNADPANVLVQVLRTSRPGTLDTSLVSTDNINNPRTMNAVYALGPRLDVAARLGREMLAGGELNNRQLNDYTTDPALTRFFQPPATVYTPHVLKDGSDSVAPLGALNRVYLNIGLFSEEWLRHFRAILGGQVVTPMEIATARANSSYWNATEAQTPDMARFLLAASGPHKLARAPGGTRYLSKDPSILRRGKIVFAENCASCHSSKFPDPPASARLADCAGPGYLECFGRYRAWAQSDAFRQEMRGIVLADDFLDGNYLSNDARVPVSVLQTNACSPLATNAIRDNIWDNFSSESYKTLPSVGTITIYDPFTGEKRPYQMPAGGRGYTRVPSLISVWSTGPYLLNNSVGHFDPSPSVAARMAVFDDSIRQMLWPERRQRDALLGDRVPGTIDRTSQASYLRVPVGYLPDKLRRSADLLQFVAPKLFGEDGGLQIGPIPAGTPVGLLANLSILPETDDPAARAEHDRALVQLLVRAAVDLKKLPRNATDAEARAVFGNLRGPLMALSKCPDLVVNRGHYFGADLPDADKQALIEFLKTF